MTCPADALITCLMVESRIAVLVVKGSDSRWKIRPKSATGDPDSVNAMDNSRVHWLTCYKLGRLLQTKHHEASVAL